MKELTFADYDKRLRSCFMGKSVGGTLGMPYEGQQKLLNLSYYDPVPTEMVANDDLDLQVMFLESVRRYGLPVHREYLAKTWLESLRFVCDEYGVAQKNLRGGLRPPVSGLYDNKFYGGMGAAIRTELWACLAPGDPQLAAALAREDSCIDHYDDGVEGAEFLAAVESAAFVEQDIHRLLEIGFSFLNKEGRFYKVIRDTVDWWAELGDFVQVRQRILDHYYVQNFTDVSINTAFIVLGLLAGEGDFGKSLCTAVNCGNDTDCTGATLGALLGILYPDGIDEKWTKPIGNKLVLGGNMIAMHEVETIDEMCDQIAALSQEVQRFYGSQVRTVGAPDFGAHTKEISCPWKASPDGVGIACDYNQRESVIARLPVYTTVIYPPQVSIALGKSASYQLRFQNIQEGDAVYEAALHVPHGFRVEPETAQIQLRGQEPVEIEVTVTALDMPKNVYLNTLDIRLYGENVTLEMSAGLPTATAWWRKRADKEAVACPSLADFAGAERVDATAHFQRVPAGRYWLTMEVKVPVDIQNAYLVAQGTRVMRVWLGDALASQADGTLYAPAFHRWPLPSRVNLSGWNRVTIEVADGNEGEIFLAFGTASGFEYLNEVEYRLPVLPDGAGEEQP